MRGISISTFETELKPSNTNVRIFVAFKIRVFNGIKIYNSVVRNLEVNNYKRYIKRIKFAVNTF